MTKEEAAEEFAKVYIDTILTRTVKAAVIYGWKAHDAQSPTDAIAFVEWAYKNDYDYLYDKSNQMRWFLKTKVGLTLSTPELYNLFNPSGAVPQSPTERMVKALEQVNAFSTGKIGSKYLGCIISDCNAALEYYYKSELSATVPQAFTPNQIEMAFYAACNMINRTLGDNYIPIETIKELHKEYMELNYPLSK